MKIIIEIFFSDSLGPCTIGCADEFIQSVKKMTSDNDEKITGTCTGTHQPQQVKPVKLFEAFVIRWECKYYSSVAVEEDHSIFTPLLPVPVDLHVADLLASKRTCVVYMYRRPLASSLAS